MLQIEKMDLNTESRETLISVEDMEEEIELTLISDSKKHEVLTHGGNPIQFCSV